MKFVDGDWAIEVRGLELLVLCKYTAEWQGVKGLL